MAPRILTTVRVDNDDEHTATYPFMPIGGAAPFNAFALTARCGLATFTRGVAHCVRSDPGLGARPPAEVEGWPSAILPLKPRCNRLRCQHISTLQKRNL